MIYQIIDLPRNMVGFKAVWDVTKKDFDEVVIPCVKKHVEKNGQLNCLLILNTSIRNYKFVSWLRDVFMGLRHICKWKRAAIVSDSRTLKYFIGLVDFFQTGKSHNQGIIVFTHDKLKEAIAWVSENK